MVITVGVDIGSITSKCVVLRDGSEVLAAEVIRAGTGSDGPQRAMQQALAQAAVDRENISYTMATGYGRIVFSEADEEMSEIACHGRGALFQEPEARTIIDIGGQDAKAIRLGPTGKVVNFAMNEKCAAGTGRFLEVMASALGFPVWELGALSARAQEKVPISSTCTVFAESEVISHLAAGRPTEDIVAGIHESIARRVAGLVRRVGLEEKALITGGVAQNTGVVSALEERLECKLTVPQYSQLNGALGAAVFAYEKYLKKTGQNEK